MFGIVLCYFSHLRMSPGLPAEGGGLLWPQPGGPWAGLAPGPHPGLALQLCTCVEMRGLWQNRLCMLRVCSLSSDADAGRQE